MNVLVAGATGAVGTVLVPQLRAAGLSVIPHVRPKTAATHPLGKDPDALVCDLSDAAALDAAMARVQAVVCLAGTMRKRFAAGDTYESSDYQPVVQLVESAKRTGPQARHFVLLSSYGTRAGAGGYLGWKWKAEEAVRASGLPWAILRPSAFDSRGSGAQPSDGGERRPPPLMGGALRMLGAVPGLRGFADDVKPIPLEVLARAIVRVVKDGAPRASVMTGRTLWQAAALH
jgi:uncharacterized protein YbjT (DUF2867 family)